MEQLRKETFINLIAAQSPVLSEGKMYPGKYVIHREASPEEVARMVRVSFENNILNRYTNEVAEQVPLKDALIIASLLEREASDFENMREVAGVIWNRLFINMPLQLDATLQYARANEYHTNSWCRYQFRVINISPLRTIHINTKVFLLLLSLMCPATLS